MSNHYNSEDEIAAVVQGFESCTTAASDFTHRAHVTVAVWYLSRGSIAEALEQMRASLFRFLDYHQVDRMKYHETLTVFWLKLVRQQMDEQDTADSLLDLTNELLEILGSAAVVHDYYSQERLWSDEARRKWLEPDRRQLDPVANQSNCVRQLMVSVGTPDRESVAGRNEKSICDD